MNNAGVKQATIVYIKRGVGTYDGFDEKAAAYIVCSFNHNGEQYELAQEVAYDPNKAFTESSQIPVRYSPNDPEQLMLEDEFQQLYNRIRGIYPQIVGSSSQAITVWPKPVRWMFVGVLVVVTLLLPILAGLEVINNRNANLIGIALNFLAGVFLAPEIIGAQRIAAFEDYIENVTNSFIGFVPDLNELLVFFPIYCAGIASLVWVSINLPPIWSSFICCLPQHFLIYMAAGGSFACNRSKSLSSCLLSCLYRAGM